LDSMILEVFSNLNDSMVPCSLLSSSQVGSWDFKLKKKKLRFQIPGHTFKCTCTNHCKIVSLSSVLLLALKLVASWLHSVPTSAKGCLPSLIQMLMTQRDGTQSVPLLNVSSWLALVCILHRLFQPVLLHHCFPHTVNRNVCMKFWIYSGG